jgi:ankyrin repeat protein
MKQPVRAFLVICATIFSLSAKPTSKEMHLLWTTIHKGEPQAFLDAIEQPDLNAQDTIKIRGGDWTAVHFAVRCQRKDMLQTLVQALHIDVNARDVPETGWTALHLAAWMGYVGEIRRLLSLGADPALTAQAATPRARGTSSPKLTGLFTAQQLAQMRGNANASAILQRAVNAKIRAEADAIAAAAATKTTARAKTNLKMIKPKRAARVHRRSLA